MFNLKLVLIAILLFLSAAAFACSDHDPPATQAPTQPTVNPTQPSPVSLAGFCASKSNGDYCSPTMTNAYVSCPYEQNRPCAPGLVCQSRSTGGVDCVAPSSIVGVPTQAPPTAPTTRPTPATQAPAPATQPPTSAPATNPPTTVGLCDIVPARREPLKLLVPLYVYPGAAWDQLVAAASKVGIIAIINPNSGPKPTPDSAYVTYMNKLHTAGIEQIGYVHTSYGTRDLSVVKAEIDVYAKNWPLIKGIFFDEVASSASELAYYTELNNYIKSKGYVHNILNPGTSTVEGYSAISTNIVIFENYGTYVNGASFANWVKCAPNQTAKSGYKYKFSGIVHTTAQSDAAAYIKTLHEKGMGLVYVTDGAGGCCTYNNLVSYFANEASAVQSINNS